MVTGLKLDAHQNHPSILHLHDTSSNTSSCWAVSVNVNLETKVSIWHPRPQWFLKGSYYAFPLFILVGVYVRAYTDLQSDKSQSPLKREIFHYYYYYFFFQELQRTANLDYKVVFLYLWYHKDNPAHWKLNGWGAGRTLGWALHASKWKPSAGFYITVFLMETNCFQEMLDVVFIKCWMSFSFHLACNVC